MDKNTASADICEGFCSMVMVNEVPAGYAVCTSFMDRLRGDPIDFDLVEEGGKYRFEYDGLFLAERVGIGIDIHRGMVARFLEEVLRQESTEWNRETYVIHSEMFDEEQLKDLVPGFVAALVCVRCLDPSMWPLED